MARHDRSDSYQKTERLAAWSVHSPTTTRREAMSQDVKTTRRAVLTGAAAAAVALPAVAVPVLEPDPIFAAIEAYKRNDAACFARAQYEDEFEERGIKLPRADDDHRTPEMAALVDANIAARMAIAETPPTTPAGLMAFTAFLREQSKLDGVFFFEDNEVETFLASLDTAVRSMAVRPWAAS
jgi:hypothetical protein